MKIGIWETSESSFIQGEARYEIDTRSSSAMSHRQSISERGSEIASRRIINSHKPLKPWELMSADSGITIFSYVWLIVGTPASKYLRSHGRSSRSINTLFHVIARPMLVFATCFVRGHTLFLCFTARSEASLASFGELYNRRDWRNGTSRTLGFSEIHNDLIPWMIQAGIDGKQSPDSVFLAQEGISKFPRTETLTECVISSDMLIASVLKISKIEHDGLIYHNCHRQTCVDILNFLLMLEICKRIFLANFLVLLSVYFLFIMLWFLKIFVVSRCNALK